MTQAVAGIVIAAVVLSTTYALGAEGIHTDGPTSKSNLESRSRASFVNGQVRLNENSSLCTSLPLDGVGQRIVDIALGQWERFGHQSLDMSKLPGRLVPGFPAPSAPTPSSEPKQQLLAQIGGFWAVTGSAEHYINGQNMRWKDHPMQEWSDHWSAAFTSWVMCEAGLDRDQFVRSVAHVDYVKQAMTDAKSAFELKPIGTRPKPADLLCATEKGPVSRNQEFDPQHPETLDRLKPRWLHCYVVVASNLAVSYVVGGNVIDWSKTPFKEFGSVGLLIVNNDSIARSPAAPCGNDAPCWLLDLRIKTGEAASYDKSPLTDMGRKMFDGVSMPGKQP
jgi:hypothetical protein